MLRVGAGWAVSGRGRTTNQIVYVAVPHMAALKRSGASDPNFLPRKLVYDADLPSRSFMRRMRLKGRAPSEREMEGRLSAEVGLAVGCDAVVSVSEGEGREFARRGFSNVHTLGHTVDARPTPRRFDERRDILFVGAIHDPDSPNADSVAWFGKRVLPLIQKSLGEDVRLLVAGHASRDYFAGLDNGRVKVLGRVEDLTELYDSALSSPTRSPRLPRQGHEGGGRAPLCHHATRRHLGWGHTSMNCSPRRRAAFAAACSGSTCTATWNAWLQRLVRRGRLLSRLFAEREGGCW